MLTPQVLVLTTRYQLGVTFVAYLGATLVSQPLGQGVLAAGLLMAANFWALRFLTARVLGDSQAKIVYALLLGIKHALLLLILAVLALVLKLDVLGLAIGIGTLFVGIGLATAHGALALRKPRGEA